MGDKLEPQDLGKRRRGRLPERIRALAQTCFIALVLRRLIRARLKPANTVLSPARALEQLTRIQHRHIAMGDPVTGNGTYLTTMRLIWRRSGGFEARAFAARMLQSSLQGRIYGVPRVECVGARATK